MQQAPHIRIWALCRRQVYLHERSGVVRPGVSHSSLLRVHQRARLQPRRCMVVLSPMAGAGRAPPWLLTLHRLSQRWSQTSTCLASMRRMFWMVPSKSMDLGCSPIWRAIGECGNSSTVRVRRSPLSTSTTMQASGPMRRRTLQQPRAKRAASGSSGPADDRC